jgi:hypothetical protein
MRLHTVFAVLGSLAAATCALCDQSTQLWYRGSFDGQVTAKNDPVAPGYYYTPSRPTTYPLYEYRESYPLPCSACGHYHKAGDWCGTCHKACNGDGAHIDKDKVYSPNPLPGQYYYSKQPHFNFRSPIRVGPPYLKYNTMW